MAIKLLNKGERTIINGDFHFEPQQSANFTPEVAAKLLRLYGGEVVKLDDKSEEEPAAVVHAEVAEEAEVAIVAEEEPEKTSKPAKTSKK